MVIHGAGRQAEALYHNHITYSAVINACTKSGDMEKTVKVLSKAEEASLKPNIITYNAVIDASAKSGDMEKYVELLSKALRPDCSPIS